MRKFLNQPLIWTRKPDQVEIIRDKVILTTQPHTDLWQRTYYGFQNDSAPVLQTKTLLFLHRQDQI